MTVLLILAAVCAFPLFRRMVRADALERAEVRLVHEAESYLRGARISRGTR